MSAHDVPLTGKPQITLRLPIDLPPGANATNWLRKSAGALHDETPQRGRKQRPVPLVVPEGWVETNLPSFVTLPQVRAHYEQLGYEVTFDLEDRAE
ncbi:hypothetical protein [Streptomyces sp. NPDC046685]|uniref:hypothetical protein n=1 Tax=Streptomyces sp. NPDC046685 TaxID=3157202 RepID=UPI0033DB87F6